MDKKTYSEKFKDPRWQKKRLEILTRDEWTCQICNDTESTLHVHHRFYEKGKNPWDYEGSALVTLCEGCHEEEHSEMQTAQSALLRAIVTAGYTSADIWNIALGFSTHKLPHTHEVSASIIEHTLSSKRLMAMLTEDFFEFLQIKNKP